MSFKMGNDIPADEIKNRHPNGNKSNSPRPSKLLTGVSLSPSVIYSTVIRQGNGGDTDVKKKDIEDGETGTVSNTFGGKDH